MVKPVGSLCNMQCKYCYYLENEQGGTGAILSDEVLKELIKKYIEENPGNVYSFVWHGGEPTLANLAFFEKVVRFQKEFAPRGSEVWNNLQTNGQLLSDEWCAFLAREHFDVGVSIDGTQAMHDENRQNRNKEGTWKNTTNAIRNLQKRGIQPDLLCTINRANALHAKETYQALKEQKTGWMQFIPIVNTDQNGTLSQDSIDAALYGQFLIDVFREWLFRDMGRAQVQLFSELIQILSGSSASLCTLLPICGQVLVVEKDGSVYSCDHFVDGAHKLGNVMKTSFTQMLESPLQKSFGQSKQSALTSECKSCPYLKFCHGGCLKDRKGLSLNGESGHYLLCEGLKRFFDYALPYLSYLLSRNKEGIPPAKIMQELLLMERKKWKNVGRNDLCPCKSGKKAKDCCWDKRI